MDFSNVLATPPEGLTLTMSRRVFSVTVTVADATGRVLVTKHFDIDMIRTFAMPFYADMLRLIYDAEVMHTAIRVNG